MIPSEVWAHLEEDTRVYSVPGRVQRRILQAGRRDFLLGLEIPSRSRMLILRVAAASTEGSPRFRTPVAWWFELGPWEPPTEALRSSSS